MMTCPNWFLELWQTFGPAAGWIALGLWLYQWFNGRHRETHGLKGESSLPTALVVAALSLLAVGIAAFARVESNQ